PSWPARRPTPAPSRAAPSGSSAGSTRAPATSPCASRGATSSPRWTRQPRASCRGSSAGDARSYRRAFGMKVVCVAVMMVFIAAYAAHRATRSIPIVMIASGDPIKTGLVTSLSRPGGNVTGLTYYAAELVEKRLQLLKEMAPSVTRVAVLGNPESDHVFGIY